MRDKEINTHESFFYQLYEFRFNFERRTHTFIILQ